MLLQTIEGIPSDGLTLLSGTNVSEPVIAPLKKVASQSDDFQFDDDAAPGESEDTDDVEEELDDDFDEDDFDDDFDDDFEDWREEDTDEFDDFEGVPFHGDAAQPCVPEVVKNDDETEDKGKNKGKQKKK